VKEDAQQQKGKEMKIAIISSYSWIKRENNYGALLQYYALQQYLEGLDHEVFWIRYNPKFKMSNKRSRLRNMLSALKRKVLAVTKSSTTRKIHDCHASFGNFLKDHVNLSEKEYPSFEALRQSPPKADLYITGSDQVWLGLEKANYLEFVEDNTKKISYGASFGKNRLTENEKETIGGYLKKFNKISIRETVGLDICRDLGREDALQVIDPTMLLDKSEYLKLDPHPQKDQKKYIVCYFLNVFHPSRVYFENIKEYAAGASFELKIIPVQGPEYLFPEKYIAMPGPARWLSTIHGAEGVITNSFHGTVFAIIMRRPFLVVLQSGSTSVQNCRFLSLLERLGLDNRIYDPGKDMQQQMEAAINWGKVEKEQEIFKQSSVAFLNACIRGMERENHKASNKQPLSSDSLNI
jgi:hypothetical protein